MSGRPLRFFITCAKGTEGALRRELVELRVHAPRGATGGVSFEGDHAQAMAICLRSRVAVRVLLELGAFQAGDAASLYAGARAIDWSELLDARTTLAVSATVHDSPELRHTGFAALKVKDAVVDAVRDRLGARPNVDPDDPDVALFLHLRGHDARLYVDLAGEPLHKRGYRVAPMAAPLKETLAAAVLALGRVALDRPFVDPMAGSGTLAIEHALAARRIAPGLLGGPRRRFGFQRWPGAARHAATWKRLVDEARAAALPAAPAPILARDLDRAALAAIRRNAAAAGVERDLRIEPGDVADLAPPAGPSGTLCTNPPYGERLEAPEALYQEAARAFARFRAWRLVLLAASPALPHALTHEPRISHRLWNGPIEVRLLCYDL